LRPSKARLSYVRRRCISERIPRARLKNHDRVTRRLFLATLFAVAAPIRASAAPLTRKILRLKTVPPELGRVEFFWSYRADVL